jgi:hypothetical protein
LSWIRAYRHEDDGAGEKGQFFLALGEAALPDPPGPAPPPSAARPGAVQASCAAARPPFHLGGSVPRTIALKAPLDESGLWHKAPDAPSPTAPDTAALPRQGAPDMTVDHPLPAVTKVFGVAAVLALAAAAVLLFLVVRPRLGGNDRASFPYWARLDEDEIRACMRGDSRAACIRVLSRMALTKYRTLWHAVDLSLVALVLLLPAAIGALA